MGVVYKFLHSMVQEERKFGCRLSGADNYETMLPQLRKS
jgi:hypothetical protein